VLVLVHPFEPVPVTVYVVVVVGETVTVVPLRLPGFHTYVTPPVPVSVVLPPVQMVPLAADDVIVGRLFTVIVRVDVFVQPLEPVPVTVYVVVVAGDTVTVAPVKLPGFHTYVTPPVAVIEVLEPAQMVALVVVVLMVGKLFTVTVTCAVFEHPPGAVPVTVYVVVVVGDTVTVVPLRLPGFHTYVVAPVPVSVVLDPLQMVEVLAEAVTVGRPVTVTVTLLVLVQPFEPTPVTV
jgi:vacuolar-type H+-ATPase subunit F/Vma7